MIGRETTLTLNDVLSLNCGAPLSATSTVIGLMVFTNELSGVQVNMPVAGSMAAPEGALVPRLKVRVLVGRSPSLAELVRTSVLPAWIVRSATWASTGALLTSLTKILNDLELLMGGEPLSVTLIVQSYKPGPCASVGIQLKTPLVAFMLAPGGPKSRLKESALPSGSVAVLVKVSVVSSLIVLSGIVVKTGGLLPMPRMVRMVEELAALWPSGFVTVTVRAPLDAPAATD